MSRCFVTGGGGFIGSRVLAAAESGEWHTGGRAERPAHLPAHVAWHRFDLMDAGSVSRVMDRVRPTHLLHLAWMDAVGGRYWQAVENIAWVEASLCLARAFASSGGQRLVAAGTCAEYTWGEPVLSEAQTPRAPASVYGRSKDALRALLDDYCRLSGLEFAWGRVFFVHGPGELPTRLVSAVASAIHEGRVAEVGSGDRRRDYLHVDDVASAFSTLIATGFQGAVNIGSGVGTPIRAIVETVAARLGRPDLVRFGVRPAAEGDPDCLVADTTRLSAIWRPRLAVDDGLRATIDALLAGGR